MHRPVLWSFFLSILAAGSAVGEAWDIPPARRPAFDPSQLTLPARKAFEADPNAFQQRHGDTLAAFKRWSPDPPSGEAECRKQKREPRFCMEERVQLMAALLKPQALATINAHIKLMPHGVDAQVPAGPGNPDGTAPRDGASDGAVSGTEGPAGPSPEPRPSGLHTTAPPGPPIQRQAEARPPAGGIEKLKKDWVDAWCRYLGCAKT
ncbi:MAG: hypothetical protein HYZ75_16825 [Elusimicrobia bacterium]|nr:hypothetical protein [Elusimicrobiota bacterium]